MNRTVSLIAMAVVVALLSFAASQVTSQPIWLSVILIASGALAAEFVQSLCNYAFKPASEHDNSKRPIVAIRFAIGASVLTCMTVSALWFVGLAS